MWLTSHTPLVVACGTMSILDVAELAARGCSFLGEIADELAKFTCGYGDVGNAGWLRRHDKRPEPVTNPHG